MLALKLLLLALVVIGTFGVLIYKLITQSKKDWATLYDLEKRASLVSTKEEIEAFHEEFREKAKKIHNEFISLRLHQIDGYLKGIYQKFKT